MDFSWNQESHDPCGGYPFDKLRANGVTNKLGMGR